MWEVTTSSKSPFVILARYPGDRAYYIIKLIITKMQAYSKRNILGVKDVQNEVKSVVNAKEEPLMNYSDDYFIRFLNAKLDVP